VLIFGQVARSAANIARMGRRGASHLGNIAPKPASVGKAKLGGLTLLAGKTEKKIVEAQVTFPLPHPALTTCPSRALVICYLHCGLSSHFLLSIKNLSHDRILMG